MLLDCEKSSPRNLYGLLLSAVVPRPIAWVSSRSKDGVDNLAPFSFFNLFSANPPILGFSPGLKRQEGSPEPVLKDTLRNVIDTEEFVVNIASFELAEKMVGTSGNYAADLSEFDALGLTRRPSEKVVAPGVRESKLSMECRLFQIVDLGSSKLVLGKIVCLHIDDSILQDGLIDVEKLNPLARLGGDLYSVVSNPFSISRPEF